MSKIKSNRAKGQLKNSPSRRKMYLIVGILLSLMLTSGAFAQWAGIISFTQKSKQKNSGELAPASLSSASPSKEYIYAGGRIIATEEPASGANPLYEGYHDTADCTSITGWAWDANQPNTPISVQIYDGTNLLATVPADQYRPDLETAGKGNGVHGFTFTTPSSLKDGLLHTIYVKYAGTTTNLFSTPRPITCSGGGGQTPFPGTHNIPGVLQAEDFDNGGQNIAYYDTNPQTNSWGAYRPNEGVDIAGPLTDGTYEVGDVVAGEWLEYTINVTSGGTFNFHARVASAGQGGNFHLVVDDNAVPGFMTVPDTGGWGTYTTITKTGVTLSPGTRVLRVAFDTNGSSGATGNFNFFEFTTAGGTGTGLKGEYFNNTLLAGSPALTRTDATVDFNWEGSPDPSINIDTFTVRWTGQVEAPTGGTYFFTLSNCDDGVKLFVNNQEVINEWRAQCCPTFSSSGITLNGGTKYDIRLEFWEQTGGASVHLLWSGPGIAQQVIPQSRLYPAAGGGCTYSISQPSQAFGASSGTGSVNVNTGASCPWAVTGNPGWITLTSGSNGTGPGPVNYLVAANTGAARSATLTIAGQSYTVTQAAGGGSSCTSVAVSPTTKTVSPAAGILTGPSVFVSPGSCTWTAASNVGWLSVTSGSPGAGNGSFGFSVQQNTTGISRTGIITVTGAAGVTANYTVKQNK
jgi:hypothetical protein